MAGSVQGNPSDTNVVRGTQELTTMGAAQGVMMGVAQGTIALLAQTTVVQGSLSLIGRAKDEVCWSMSTEGAMARSLDLTQEEWYNLPECNIEGSIDHTEIDQSYSEIISACDGLSHSNPLFRGKDKDGKMFVIRLLHFKDGESRRYVMNYCLPGWIRNEYRTYHFTIIDFGTPKNGRVPIERRIEFFNAGEEHIYRSTTSSDLTDARTGEMINEGWENVESPKTNTTFEEMGWETI